MSARLNMILGQVMTNDMTDKRVLDALAAVPRENFVPEKLRGAAYVDDDLPVGEGRFLIEPMVLARLLQQANIQPASNVLVIGAAPGYIAAVAAQMAARVLGTESSEALADLANANIQSLGLWHAKVLPVADLAQGYAEEGPFDTIILGGAVAEMPPALAAQLAEGGTLVGVRSVACRPGSDSGLGKAFVARKKAGLIAEHELFDACIPCLPDAPHSPTFVF